MVSVRLSHDQLHCIWHIVSLHVVITCAIQVFSMPLILTKACADVIKEFFTLLYSYHEETEFLNE